MSKRATHGELLRRRRRVSELRLQGWTLEEIGRELGIHFSQVSRDWKWCREEWRKAAIQDTGEILAEQIAQYKLVIREAWAAWQKSKEAKAIKAVESRGDTGDDQQGHERGRRVPSKTMLRTEEQTGNPAYFATMDRANQQINKLLGIDGSQASIVEAIRGAADLVKLMDQAIIAPPATEQPPQPDPDPQGNGNGKP